MKEIENVLSESSVEKILTQRITFLTRFSGFILWVDEKLGIPKGSFIIHNDAAISLEPITAENETGNHLNWLPRELAKDFLLEYDGDMFVLSKIISKGIPYVSISAFPLRETNHTRLYKIYQK